MTGHDVTGLSYRSGPLCYSVWAPILLVQEVVESIQGGSIAHGPELLYTTIYLSMLVTLDCGQSPGGAQVA
jgi:hypothetical protein